MSGKKYISKDFIQLYYARDRVCKQYHNVRRKDANAARMSELLEQEKLLRDRIEFYTRTKMRVSSELWLK